ncbi:MAG: small basic protein [PVC group bacterium]|nr:small basic protein [PVC group bacterium]
MSIHPSLTASKGKGHRSVLKRFERVEKLKKAGKWTDDTSSFGLPKVKIIKMKLKKSKAAEAKTAEEGAAATPATKDGAASKAASK